MTTVTAVYENGVLRPTRPLDFAEGQTVEVTVTDPPTISDEEYARRIRAAKDIHEWIEVTKLLPPDDGGYDIIKALEDNRRWSAGLPPLEGEERPR